jgi:phage protein D
MIQSVELDSGDVRFHERLAQLNDYLVSCGAERLFFFAVNADLRATSLGMEHRCSASCAQDRRV